MAFTLSTKQRPKPDAMTLWEHLGELRHRLMVAALALVAGAVLVFFLYEPVMRLLLHPYCGVVGPHRACTLYVTGPLDGLSIRVKLAAYGGTVLASPVIFWQLWRFVVPGLTRRERNYAVPFVASSVTLFLLGAFVAYLTFPHALGWLHSIGGPSLTTIYSPASYLGLLVLLMVAFGVTFELPLLLVFLQLAGVVTPKRLARWRRGAIIALVAFAAVITPSSDPFSMLALAVPLVIFYELAIVVGRLLPRVQRGTESGE